MGIRKLIFVVALHLVLEGSCVFTSYVQTCSPPQTCTCISASPAVVPAGQFVIPAVIKPILQPDMSVPYSGPAVPNYPVDQGYRGFPGGAPGPYGGGMPPIIFEEDDDNRSNNWIYWLLLAMSRRGFGGGCGGGVGGGYGGCGGCSGGGCGYCSGCGGCGGCSGFGGGGCGCSCGNGGGFNNGFSGNGGYGCGCGGNGFGGNGCGGNGCGGYNGNSFGAFNGNGCGYNYIPYPFPYSCGSSISNCGYAAENQNDAKQESETVTLLVRQE